MTKFNLLMLTALVLQLNAPTSLAQEKKLIKLVVSYSRINDQNPELKAMTKSKTGKKFLPVEGVDVEFFLGEQSTQNLVGKAKSNARGIASIELTPPNLAKLDSLSSFKVI